MFRTSVVYIMQSTIVMGLGMIVLGENEKLRCRGKNKKALREKGKWKGSIMSWNCIILDLL